jgi:hypothetical protein
MKLLITKSNGRTKRIKEEGEMKKKGRISRNSKERRD